jgi:hypothetical protein
MDFIERGELKFRKYTFSFPGNITGNKNARISSTGKATAVYLQQGDFQTTRSFDWEGTLL